LCTEFGNTAFGYPAALTVAIEIATLVALVRNEDWADEIAALAALARDDSVEL
jgi:hypothetical protein